MVTFLHPCVCSAELPTTSNLEYLAKFANGSRDLCSLWKIQQFCWFSKSNLLKMASEESERVAYKKNMENILSGNFLIPEYSGFSKLSGFSSDSKNQTS